MKKLSIFIIVLLTSTVLWSQNQIVTTIIPKTSVFPSTGLNYLDDPAKYFTIQMINTSGTDLDIFFTIELTADFTATNQNYYVRTKKEVQPQVPLTVGLTPVYINRAIFDQIIGNLNSSAYETNYDPNKLVQDMLQLPEGQYRFCITPYRWDGYNNPNPVQVGEQACYVFSICYTGSSPEFTSPVNGMSAANLNNSNPANNTLSFMHGVNTVESAIAANADIHLNEHLLSSDNRESMQYTRLPISRQVIFSWTGVISNCMTSSDFDYTIKMVEVDVNQNVSEAINWQGTLFTKNVGSNTMYTFDTVANRQFRLQRGHVYAAEVMAVPKKNLMTEIQLSNGGKSQVIAFVWGEDEPILFGGGSNSLNQLSNVVTDNHSDVLASIRSPYFVLPGQDKTTVNQLKSSFQTESALIPSVGDNTYVTNVENGDQPYYEVAVSDTLAVKWMPVRGDSVFKVNYTAELYEYNGGVIANSMIGQPLKTASLVLESPHDFSPTATELLSVPTTEWTASLEEGYKYVLHLEAETYYSYEKKTTYKTLDFIHGIPVDQDSVVTEVAFASTELSSDVVFSWGKDSSTLDKVYPPQFSYPVNNSNKNWYDTIMTNIPEVSKFEDFKFKWKKAEGVDYQDSVYYKLLVAELPNGKKPQQVSDTLFFKDSITTTSYIDTVLFDSLKTGKQYMAVLWAYIVQKEDTSEHYNLLNNGKSIYATFKLIEREYNADLNDKIKCSPHALDNLSKDIITPKADSLVTNKVQLKMGDFPLILQTATLDTAKKRYSGDGYVVWHPFGVDARLKVKVDTIQINKNFEIINGTAVSTATDSSTYIASLMNDLNLADWTSDDIDRVAAQFGEIEEVKEYYEKFKKYDQKYGKKYGGLLAPVFGGDGDFTTEVLTFPLCVTDKDITGSDNIIYSINNMFFSPVTALMNIWAIFAARDDDYYIPFLANNICMDQQNIFKKDLHIELFMARSYEKELNDGYKLRFKASSSFSDPKDGTVIIIDTGALKCIRAEMQIDLNSNDFRGLDKDGLPRKGNVVKASLMAEFTDWDDWTVKAYMDPFAVAGCDRYTFFPTGKGIWYDHSSTSTPNAVSLTYEYLFGTPPPAEMKDDDKKKLTKATKEWQGFYWDELKVFLSDEISGVFSDTIKEKDSMVVYKYGLNNTEVDSVHYNFPGTRINFGASGLIIDKYGFTCDFFARDLLDANTKQGWGWAFTLDTINMRFTKNQYKETKIKGRFGIPLFKSDFLYSCSAGVDSLMFAIKSAKDTMDFDLWVGSVLFDSASSYFRIQKNFKESGTRIDLTMNGRMTLKTSKLGFPSDFSLMKFEHMGMRNYNLDGQPKQGVASIQNFEFDPGEWSFASPQKYIGGYSPDFVAEQQAENADISFLGFTFSLQNITPVIAYNGDDLKIGLNVVGKMKFATDGADLGATTGFALWGVTEPKNKFHIKEVSGKLDSIVLDNIDFEVFKLSGKLGFETSCSTCTDITGFKGALSVTILNEVKLSMRAGFGKEKDGYSWWFFDGSCKFPGGIPIGPVSINGFSGGFAYNMKPKKSITDPSYNAVNLLGKAEGNTDQSKVLSSGMDFTPWKDSWVANAGISLVLTGAENTMNADGLVSLRIVDKHFSGVFIEANAYVITSMDKAAVPGDGSNNGGKELVRAKAIMGFETTNQYDYFRFSLCVKAQIDLASLLEGVSSTVLGDPIAEAIHSGLSLATNPNVANTLTKLVGDEHGQGADASGISSHSKDDRDRAANASSGSGGKPGFNTEALIPIDFELKHYKKTYEGHKKGNTDWYFSIGKPKYEERVQLKNSLDLVVLKDESEFTFYLQTGNAFAYEMPPLSQALQDFFGISSGNKQLDADAEQVKNSRKIPNTDWLTIDRGGGFCMGATFHSETEMNFFLYVDVTSDLGFDVALLDVGGMGCPGHEQIGKNNFYALGRIYAALQGDVGLKLNLGFWKGKFSLFEAGVGALLQGGGPNPSYCYGLLRFKVNLLNGLLKFSTSCDFSIGDVCVPGAGDPLANVKLFQNVTPGFENEASAKNSSNQQSALQVGTIVSNMPWDQDVMLADQDGTNARKFRFILLENDCRYYNKANENGSYTLATGEDKLKFTASRNDENVILFETGNGGFVPDRYSKISLSARAFEWRAKVNTKDLKNIQNGQNADCTYYVSGVNKGKVNSKTPNSTDYDWFDPTFYDEATGRLTVKKFQKDTIVYFRTKALGSNLNNGVVFSWPYNGDQTFPRKEYVHATDAKGTTPYCNLYPYRRRDELFDKSTLNASGKKLKVFLLGNGMEEGELTECEYSYYPNATVPYVKVKLPNKEYENDAYGARMLRFLMVDNNAYNSAVEAAEHAMSITKKQAEYSSRITDQTYAEAEAAHNRKTGGSQGTSSIHEAASTGGNMYEVASTIASGENTYDVASTTSGPFDAASSVFGGTATTSYSGVIANSFTSGGTYQFGHAMASSSSSSSSSSSIASTTTSLNLQDEMLNEIYENKQEVGKDSMTYYRTMLKEDYKICSAIGEEVYKWTWFVDYGSSTYLDFLHSYLSGYKRTDLNQFKKDLPKFNVYNNNSYLSLVPDASENSLESLIWMFVPYDPGESARYNTSCQMPPVAFLALDRNNNNLMNMHKKYFQFFLDLKRDFKQTPLLLERRSYVEDGEFRYHTSGSGGYTVSGSLKNELQGILSSGLRLNHVNKFERVDSRIKGGTNYTLCTPANYDPTTVDVPCLLDFFSDRHREPMDDKYFDFKNYGAHSLSETSRWPYAIRDYATVTISKDIRMIHDFMQETQRHAYGYDQRGWSHKVDIFKKYYSAAGKNSFLSYSNFPYDMPELFMVTHYFTALDNLYMNIQYTSPSGSTFQLYHYDNEFIRVSDLKLKDSYWAKYWWHAWAQSLDYAPQGFDRNFYTNSNAKYFNTVTTYNNGGRHVDEGYRKLQMKGEWASKNLLETYRIFWNNQPLDMNVQIYYLTSQAPNFDQKLMLIAKAVKESNAEQNMRIFYPNATLTSPNTYYRIKYSTIQSSSFFSNLSISNKVDFMTSSY